MPNVVGSVPEFTTDETPEGTQAEEVKEPAESAQAPADTETDTPAGPPTAEQAAEGEEKPQGDGAVNIPKEVLEKEVARATEGLRNEIVKLNRQLREASGKDRVLIQEKIDTKQTQLDKLDDLHPDDVALVERVIRSKGYKTGEEIAMERYEEVKRLEIERFLEKYPEYKPENDSDDVNWGRLQSELSLYRSPQDARQIGALLERAHRAISPVPSVSTKPKERQVATASAGSQASVRTPQKKSLPAHHIEELRRGGWSEEEINALQK